MKCLKEKMYLRGIKMQLFDTHLHTHHSHDGAVSCSGIADIALKNGLFGITITDHFDSGLYKSSSDYEHIRKSFAEAQKASESYEGKLIITSGVEMGDYLFGKSIADKCMQEIPFDFVLCSVHASQLGKKLFGTFENTKQFALMSDEQNKTYIKEYFKCILETVSVQDFDSLAHLTYPLRYIVAINKKPLDITFCMPTIKEILHLLINKNKALEINTSCLATDWKYPMPDYSIIREYYNMGGRLVTIGSDAHRTERIGLGIYDILCKLKTIGFTSYYYYKERNPIEISLL